MVKEFLQGRIELVKHLATDVAKAHYADMVLILTAALSACASRRWPGDHIDKKRFVELLVRCSPQDFHTSWVSLPALLGDHPGADKRPAGMPDTRILCGHEVDVSYEEAERQYPDFSAKQLREHSYASLIYRWLRCGYAREYWANENVTHVPAPDEKARVSYIGRATRDGQRRMVSFHIEYLVELAEHHVSILPSAPCAPPSDWWVDGDQCPARLLFLLWVVGFCGLASQLRPSLRWSCAVHSQTRQSVQRTGHVEQARIRVDVHGEVERRAAHRGLGSSGRHAALAEVVPPPWRSTLRFPISPASSREDPDMAVSERAKDGTPRRSKNQGPT